MDLPERWICSGNDYRRLPDEIIEMGMKAFINEDMFENAFDILYEEESPQLIRLPLMDNLEAIAYGGILSVVSNMYIVKEYNYKRLDEFNIKPGDLVKTDEVKCVLDYIRKNKDKNIMLDIEGPFSIIAGLIRSEMLFMCQRKGQEVLREKLFMIADDLIIYAKEAIKAGVRLISFSDPQSGIDMVGQNFYSEFCGAAIMRFLKGIEPYLDNAVLHVCGKTSFGLLKSGMAEQQTVRINLGDYRNTLFSIAGDADFRIIGNACINDSRKSGEYVNKLVLKE